MKKLVLATAMLAMMLVATAPVLAETSDDSGSGGVEQSQNVAISQYAAGDGNQQSAEVSVGDQTATQAQYGGESSIAQEQDVAVEQYAAGDDNEQSASVEVGDQTSTQMQYGSEEDDGDSDDTEGEED